MSEDFFDGFTWAVPKAFSAAVSACRFEEGDILYDSRYAYHIDWEKAQKHINYSIQVHSPLRGATQSAFEKNWATEVVFRLNNHQSDETSKYIETTQGKLFTALWRGDLSALDHDFEAELPHTLKTISKKLEQAIPAVKELAAGKPVFIMVRDMANDNQKLKHMKVSAALYRRFNANLVLLTPKEAGLDEWEKISPTIDIACYAMESGTHVEIHDALKEQLYTPAKDAKKDMFRLSAHGLLLAG